ncbi:MAG: type 4a pilus biogenesis protein PilO [Akkermansiaceae bacterium]|nr:type 4a pilus biogenesis protein PilO [Armatimonadota bacterium]
MKPTSPDPAVPAPATPTTGFALKPSKQTAMILAGLIGLSLSGTAGYSFWQNGIREQQAAIIRNKTQQVNDSQMVANQLDATEAEFQQVQGRIGRLETAVSENDYVPTLLKQIERLAKENDLRVDGQQQSFEAAPEPPADPEARKKFVSQPYDKEYITLRVRGRYWNLARFMYRLTEFPKILSVEKLEFRPQDAVSNKSPLLSITVNLTGYLFKPSENAPAPAPATGLEVPTIPTAAPSLPPRREI